jgi:hypothetical protein
MPFVCGLILLTSAYPFWRAWRSNRGTSLVYSLLWAAAAWAAWTASVWVWGIQGWAATLVWRFVAFALTGCAAVAVLGARRPGAGAWNFVVVGLLAVLLLPLAFGFARGEPRPETLNIVFMAGVVAVGVLNYLPTRLAPAAILVAAACGMETAIWLNPDHWYAEPGVPVSPLLIGMSPWLVYLEAARWPMPLNEFDRLWLRFRNRFGLVWSQRLREQFNRAAANAGWPVVLRWQGLRRQPGTELPDREVQEQIVSGLRALLTRFEPAEKR